MRGNQQVLCRGVATFEILAMTNARSKIKDVEVIHQHFGYLGQAALANARR